MSASPSVKHKSHTQPVTSRIDAEVTTTKQKQNPNFKSEQFSDLHSPLQKKFKLNVKKSVSQLALKDNNQQVLTRNDGFRTSHSEKDLLNLLFERCKEFNDDDLWRRFVRTKLKVEGYDLLCSDKDQPSESGKRQAILTRWIQREGENATLGLFEKRISEFFGRNQDTTILPAGRDRSRLVVRIAGTSSEESSMMEAAIEKLKRVQKSNKEEEMQTVVQVHPSSIPSVHTRMCFVELYQQTSASKSGRDKFVQFAGLIELLAKRKFAMLVGQPGSGKSTCYRRLMRLKDDKPGICLGLNLRDIDEDQRRTLRQLLLDENYPDVDDETLRLSFRWIKENQDKCIIVMDGLDQFPWSLKGAITQQATYETTLTPLQLIANLFGRKFLKNVGLLVTSRRHAVIDIPKPLRPSRAVELQALSADDMEKLFLAFCGSQTKFERFKETLNANAPLVWGLCRNPLMLQFAVCALSETEAELAGSPLFHTTTTMFETVLNRLRYTLHWRESGLGVEQLLKCLGALALDAVAGQLAGIKGSSLLDAGLTAEQVQNLLFPIVTVTFSNDKLSDARDTTFHFTHETWKEYFAAHFLTHNASREVFQSKVTAAVSDPRWQMVRKFLCGHLLNVPYSQVRGNPRAESFFREIEVCFAILAEGEHHAFLLDLMEDLLECSDDVARVLAKSFPTSVRLVRTKLKSGSAHALARMLKLADKEMELIDLRNCFPDRSALKQISGALDELGYMVQVLDLSFNLFTNDVVDILCHMVQHVRDEYRLRGAFDYGGKMQGADPWVRCQFREAQIRYDNEELKIFRVYDSLM